MTQFDQENDLGRGGGEVDAETLARAWRESRRQQQGGGEREALLIVDFQNDFTPGGALPVAGGDEIGPVIDRLLDRFGLVIATRDWHPPDHGSFRGVDVDPELWDGREPPAIWPVHCVQGTRGAELHPGLDRTRVDRIVDKGQDRGSQGYSAFQGTDLAELLRGLGVERLYVAGLATDYCVKHSVLDARRQGFDVVVVEDAIRGVDAKSGDSGLAIDEMKAAGARFVRSDEPTEARRRGSSTSRAGASWHRLPDAGDPLG